MRRIFNIKWSILALLALTAVIVLTHIPQSVLDKKIKLGDWDKVVHGLSYMVVAILFLKAISFRRRWLVFFMVFVLLAGIGATDELTQPFVRRTASVYDWLADCAGICLAGIFICLLHRQPKAVPETPECAPPAA